MLIDTLDALARLDYPRYEVIVIDNNTRDPAIWQPVEAHCHKLGDRFRFFHVDPLSGYNRITSYNVCYTKLLRYQMEQGLLVNRQVFGNNPTGEQLYEDTMGIQGGSTPRLAVRADDSLRCPDASIHPAGEPFDVATGTCSPLVTTRPDSKNRWLP